MSMSFFFLLNLCHSIQSLDVFFVCFVILVNLDARNSNENEEKLKKNENEEKKNENEEKKNENVLKTL